jgi:hypothetical protein
VRPVQRHEREPGTGRSTPGPVPATLPKPTAAAATVERAKTRAPGRTRTKAAKKNTSVWMDTFATPPVTRTDSRILTEPSSDLPSTVNTHENRARVPVIANTVERMCVRIQRAGAPYRKRCAATRPVGIAVGGTPAALLCGMFIVISINECSLWSVHPTVSIVDCHGGMEHVGQR